MNQSNLSKIYMIQGINGPVVARRPADDALKMLMSLDFGDRLGYAEALSKAGFLIDYVADVVGFDYWRLMEFRRQYGYTWVPSALQKNVLIIPGISQPNEAGEILVYNPVPPQGAILVPESEEKDPNTVVVSTKVEKPFSDVKDWRDTTYFLSRGVPYDNFKVGETWTDEAGVKWVKEIFRETFAPYTRWKKA